MSVFKDCKEQAKESEKALGREEKNKITQKEGEEGASGKMWFTVFSAAERWSGMRIHTLTPPPPPNNSKMKRGGVGWGKGQVRILRALSLDG